MSSKKAEYFVTTEPVVAYRRRQPIIQKRLFKRSIVVMEPPSDVESPCDTESPDDNEYWVLSIHKLLYLYRFRPNI